MEGLYFYWLAWIGWILATFFMNKDNPLRMKFAVVLLAVIIAAPYKANFLIFDYHLSAIVIAFFVFFETRRIKLVSFLYLFLSSFIIMLAYTSFLMFELFDPVWVLFDRKIMLGAAGFYLALLLHKDKHFRMLALISGFMQGEFLYAAILWRFDFPYTAGSMAFLDLLSISVGLLLAWSAVETMIAVISGSTINQAEGEEHKTS